MRAAKFQLVLLQPRRELLELEEVATRAGVHPEMVHRLIDLGLIQAVDVSSAATLLEPQAVQRIRVIQRLRCDLGVNLQGIGVILELLDRLNAKQRGGRRGNQ